MDKEIEAKNNMLQGIVGLVGNVNEFLDEVATINRELDNVSRVLTKKVLYFLN